MGDIADQLMDQCFDEEDPGYNDAHHLERCVVRRETPKAWLVLITDLGLDQWVPKSQLHEECAQLYVGYKGTVLVTQWLGCKIGEESRGNWP